VSGTLHVVSTPIGNLGDVTARAADVLRAADLVLCEDTRHSRRLLDHVGSRAPTTSVHEHNEARRADELVARLAAGATMALVSDAGTPLLSDPGARLVAGGHRAGVRVEPGAGRVGPPRGARRLGARRDALHVLRLPARKGRERREASPRWPRRGTPPCSTRRPGARATPSPTWRRVRRRAARRTRPRADEAVRRSPPRNAGRPGRVLRRCPAARRGRAGGGGRTAAAAGRRDGRGRARGRARLRAGGAATREVARALAERFGLSRNDAYRAAQDAAEADEEEP
jgi:16S rRNA (cytidine1402-2'-O)-methyltransferase